VKEYGINLAVDMLRRITADGKVPGVHFCTLNLERSIQRVLEILNWHGVTQPPHNKLIQVLVLLFIHGRTLNIILQDSPNNKTAGLPQGEHDYVVDPSEATSDAKFGLAHLPRTETEAGSGELNNAASWDDFPNGRFGDFKSPAFGEQGLWGQSLVRSETVVEWGQPKTLDDLTRVFLDHLHSKIATTPFSPTSLSPESLMILDQLEALTKRGWWTVGSQPAVNGKSSEDQVLGWGPKAGYVFQKGFVEFFCDQNDVEKIEDLVQRSGQGWVHYFAANAEVSTRFRLRRNRDGSHITAIDRETVGPMSQTMAVMRLLGACSLDRRSFKQRLLSGSLSCPGRYASILVDMSFLFIVTCRRKRFLSGLTGHHIILLDPRSVRCWNR